MGNSILLYLGAVITFLWGAAHLFPTGNIVRGFGNITEDNKNIITMEWIIEGVSLIFAGIIVSGITIIGEVNNVATFVYMASSGFLIVLAIISLFTGFKVKFLPFKLCPVLFTLSAVLILTGCFA